MQQARWWLQLTSVGAVVDDDAEARQQALCGRHLSPGTARRHTQTVGGVDSGTNAELCAADCCSCCRVHGDAGRQHTLLCHELCDEHEVPQQCLVALVHLAQTREAAAVLGDDQEVHGRLRAQQSSKGAARQIMHGAAQGHAAAAQGASACCVAVWQVMLRPCLHAGCCARQHAAAVPVLLHRQGELCTCGLMSRKASACSSS